LYQLPEAWSDQSYVAGTSPVSNAALSNHGGLLALIFLAASRILLRTSENAEKGKKADKRKRLPSEYLRNEADETRTHNLRIDSPMVELVSIFGKTVYDYQ